MERKAKQCGVLGYGESVSNQGDQKDRCLLLARSAQIFYGEVRDDRFRPCPPDGHMHMSLGDMSPPVLTALV